MVPDRFESQETSETEVASVKLYVYRGTAQRVFVLDLARGS